MELYVKMTDEQYQEYQDYIKHKEEYVKKSEVPVYDVIKRDYDRYDSNYNTVLDAQEILFKHRTKRIEICITDYDWREKKEVIEHE